MFLKERKLTSLDEATSYSDQYIEAQGTVNLEHMDKDRIRKEEEETSVEL